MVTIGKGSPTDEGYSLLTGVTMFASIKAWDTQALGLASEGSEIEDPEAFSDLVHPLLSPNTIKVFEGPLTELDGFTRNTPFMQGGLKFPEEYFRGPQGPSFAELLDERWRERHDGTPPEGEVPPSQAWDGRWYFYAVLWWKVVGPDVQQSGGAT